MAFDCCFASVVLVFSSLAPSVVSLHVLSSSAFSLVSLFSPYVSPDFCAFDLFSRGIHAVWEE